MQCSFFQACALPAPFVEAVHMLDADRDLVRSFAQWRLDYPLPPGWALPQDELPVLSVAESILTRGAIPYCSPRLEKALDCNKQKDYQPEALLSAMGRVALVPSCRLLPLQFDSREERMMFDRVSALIGQEELPWSLMPQIYLACLTPNIDPGRASRGDFLLAHCKRDPVVLEVDGEQHALHTASDEERDQALSASGIRVVRVKAEDVRNDVESELGRLYAILREGRVQIPEETLLSGTLRWYKYLHQIQVALLIALRSGWLRFSTRWSIGVALPAVLSSDPRAGHLVRLAVGELVELLGRLGRLYGLPGPMPDSQVALLPEGRAKARLDLLIGPADGTADRLAPDMPGRFLISDVLFPGEIRAPVTSSPHTRPQAPTREEVRWFLRYLFRKDEFREGQWEVVDRTLRGLDSVVLLPTGAGKSIAFQLAALLLPGRCIVVDPLISLIDDQIDNLALVGIDRCVGITRELDDRERELAYGTLASGHCLFCYIAPERLQIAEFRDALRALTVKVPVSVIAIDEAHCVSEWGHDFRTAYLNLGRITRDLCASDGVVPPLVALTGTAGRIVLKDVQRELGIASLDAVITPRSFDRPELRYVITTCRSSQKMGRVLGLLQAFPTRFGMGDDFFRPAGKNTHAGLVFCPHVGGGYGVVAYAQSLERGLGTQVCVYSGKAPKNVDPTTWEATKKRVARDFKRNRVTLLCCTNAFGMGIDKPNIRYTVHIGLPPSIESFYQEAGRAGRDQRPAECAIVLSNDDPNRSRWALSPSTPLDELAETVRKVEWQDSDDIVRSLWFHVRSFRGVKAEAQDVARMLEALGDVTQKRNVSVSWSILERSAVDGNDRHGTDESDQAKERAEKALHRLVVLGVVEDYTVDYGKHEFGVTTSGATQEQIAEAFAAYARAYQWRLGEQALAEALELRMEPHRDFVLAVAERLIEFIYQHVELARRRALAEMLDAAASAKTGEDLRRRILDYLQQTEWDERLEAVRTSTRGGLDSLDPVLEDLISPTDAVALRAASGRALASYPDVPGLLILRAVSEALAPDGDPEVVGQNVQAGVAFAFRKFRLEPDEVASGLGQAVVRACRKAGAGELMLRAALAYCKDPSFPWSAARAFVRALVQRVPGETAWMPAWWLLRELVSRCTAVTELEGE